MQRTMTTHLNGKELRMGFTAMKLSKANKGISFAFNVLAMVAMVKQVFGIGEKKEKKVCSDSKEA